MKNRFLTLLTLTMLTGSLLVGCGGSETDTDNGTVTNAEANVDAETDEMSEEAISIFNAIREGVEETNATRKANVSDYTGIIEADSPEGMTYLGESAVVFVLDEDNVENFVSLITMYNNGWVESYYLEFVNETDTYVEFNIYVKEGENPYTYD